MENISFAVLTVSDSCYNGTATDSSGKNLQALIRDKYHVTAVKYMIVPDDFNKIEGTLKFFSDVLNIEVIFTTGGTGFSPRDVTPEATRRVITKETPQLTLAMAMCSFQKTKFAALSRAISGIRNKSLIINFPGSKKASAECFESIADVLMHAVEVLIDRVPCVRETHNQLQNNTNQNNSKENLSSSTLQLIHRCPHKTNIDGSIDDRNSPYPMIPVDKALEIIFEKLIRSADKKYAVVSNMDLPPFRASIKDGYALKSKGGKGQKRVLDYIPAGHKIITNDFDDQECYKISTGAAVPMAADCIIQVEDTKVVQIENGIEKIIDILTEPLENLDIRPIGCDLKKCDDLFDSHLNNPGNVVFKSLMASIGLVADTTQPTIGIISTGDELIEPGQSLPSGKIYDSNTTMLKELLNQFGFTKIHTTISADSFDSLCSAMENMTKTCEITICTGGVSMGDKDFVKSCLHQLQFTVHFGRVNMKPGKPMTFATNECKTSVFGLPGNPVSAFVCFHLFVLPALRTLCHYPTEKLSMATVEVELLNERLMLDPRPEYVRATITKRNSRLYAEVTGDQISSRLKSIYGADVLLHLPGRTEQKKYVEKGTILKASVLRHDFISKYE